MLHDPLLRDPQLRKPGSSLNDHMFYSIEKNLKNSWSNFSYKRLKFKKSTDRTGRNTTFFGNIFFFTPLQTSFKILNSSTIDNFIYNSTFLKKKFFLCTFRKNKRKCVRVPVCVNIGTAVPQKNNQSVLSLSDTI